MISLKDEIKEILDRLKNNDFERDCNDGSCYKELYLSEIETLLDYIINLKKEVRINNDLIPYFKNNEKSLKKQITALQKENEALKELNVCVGCNNNPDYKTRIDKASDMLVCAYGGNDDYYMERIKKAQKILKGEDE